MNTTKYLIAKYIPDLNRMEPRNVGIVVWSPEGIEARFLAEKPNNPGELDGRSIPSFVTSPSAYRQWIQFWRSELAKAEIESAKSGVRVSRSSLDFLTALESWNQGNFVLAEGGVLLDAIDADDLPTLTEHLFRTLVDTGGADEPRDPTLDELCNRLIEETRLSSDPHFISRYSLSCEVATNTIEKFEFSHAYANGTLQRLYQRVPLSKRKSQLRKTVHDSAWMLEKVIRKELVTRDQSGVLVYVTDEQRADTVVDEAIRVLGSVTRVLNLHDYARVRSEFAELAFLAPAH